MTAAGRVLKLAVRPSKAAQILHILNVLVSPIVSGRLSTLREDSCLRKLAECNSAIQQIQNLRYKQTPETTIGKASQRAKYYGKNPAISLATCQIRRRFAILCG
jgi:hypothetical protein